jgi:hypothetical protein
MKCMLVGKHTLLSVKFRNLKIHNVFDITPIFLKLCIFTNLNIVFLVLVLVFDFDELSEGYDVTWPLSQRSHTANNMLFMYQYSVLSHQIKYDQASLSANVQALHRRF